MDTQKRDLAEYLKTLYMGKNPTAASVERQDT